MLSEGIFTLFAFSIAILNLALASGLPPPVLAAIVNSLASLVNTLPLTASSLDFLCLIFAHFECPEIIPPPEKFIIIE
jgi:hypothetical protein